MLLIGHIFPSNTPRQNIGKRGDLPEKTLIVLFVSSILSTFPFPLPYFQIAPHDIHTD